MRRRQRPLMCEGSHIHSRQRSSSMCPFFCTLTGVHVSEDSLSSSWTPLKMTSSLTFKKACGRHTQYSSRPSLLTVACLDMDCRSGITSSEQVKACQNVVGSHPCCRSCLCSSLSRITTQWKHVIFSSCSLGSFWPMDVQVLHVLCDQITANPVSEA